MLRASVLVSAVFSILACSNNSPPEGLSHECTFYGETDVYAVATPAPPVDAGRIIADPTGPMCLPPGLLSPDDAGRVECMLLVTLPGPGDESACAESGLDVPTPDVLDELRARGPLHLPTCVVPQLLGSQLDATGSCAESPQAGWCYVAATLGEACAQIDVSPPTIRPGVFALACTRGC
jgi:hypothetical protein